MMLLIMLVKVWMLIVLVLLLRPMLLVILSKSLLRRLMFERMLGRMSNHPWANMPRRVMFLLPIQMLNLVLKQLLKKSITMVTLLSILPQERLKKLSLYLMLMVYQVVKVILMRRKKIWLMLMTCPDFW